MEKPTISAEVVMEFPLEPEEIEIIKARAERVRRWLNSNQSYRVMEQAKQENRESESGRGD